MGKKLLAILFLLSLSYASLSQLITTKKSSGNVSDEVRPTFLHANRLVSSDNCEPTYGVMPCTDSILGNAFLILVYGYCIFRATKILTDESDQILLQILAGDETAALTRKVGGFFLPMFSSIPFAIIILASGLPQNKETAQRVISVGMGLLAGTTVTLQTLLWGSCVIVSKRDHDNSKCSSSTGPADNIDEIPSTYAARIMVISVIPIIVGLLQVLKKTSQSRLAILISFIISFSLLVLYGLCQIIWPWIQKKKKDYVKQKLALSIILRHFKMIAIGRLRKDNGEPNLDAVTRSFKMIDKDNDGYISGIELKALLLGMNLDGIDLDNIDDSAEKVLREFDTSGDSRISMDECVQKISKWLHEFNPSDVHHDHHRPQKFYFTHHRPKPIRLKYNFHSHGKPSSSHHRPPPIRFGPRFLKSDAGVEQGNGNLKWIACKAVLMLLLGTAIAAVFAAPIVDAVDKFATATSIPSFFVSFVILPFASSSDVVPALLLASRKKSAANLTFSEIYRVVTISNILGLSVFLGLIYIRHLTWEFSTEMLIIVIVCTAMGLLVSFRTTFHPWMSVVAFALYALSLALVYVLDYVLGLS